MGVGGGGGGGGCVVPLWMAQGWLRTKIGVFCRTENGGEEFFFGVRLPPCLVSKQDTGAPLSCCSARTSSWRTWGLHRCPARRWAHLTPQVMACMGVHQTEVGQNTGWGPCLLGEPIKIRTQHCPQYGLLPGVVHVLHDKVPVLDLGQSVLWHHTQMRL